MSSAVQTEAPLLGVKVLPADLPEDLCNSADSLAAELPPGCKLIWHVRHGQSTGNVAKEIAREADRGTGAKAQEDAFRCSDAYLDTPLTDLGKEQACGTRALVAQWQRKPQLVVCSPLCRAIQTAALIFHDELEAGRVRLVLRPELRECFPNNNENSGRPIAELRACPHLTALPAWPHVDAALAQAASEAWASLWDTAWARGEGGAWQAHCRGPERFDSFDRWLANTAETRVAVVSHWGTINNIMNRQPWADGAPRTPVAVEWDAPTLWPAGGIAKRFAIRNCGWIAVIASP